MRIDHEAQRIALRRAGGASAGADSPDRREDTALAQPIWNARRLTRVALKLDVNQPIERNGRGILRFHEESGVADVPRRDRCKADRTRGILPREARRQSDA